MTDIQPWFDGKKRGRCSKKCKQFMEHGDTVTGRYYQCKKSEIVFGPEGETTEDLWMLCNPWVLELIKERDELKVENDNLCKSIMVERENHRLEIIERTKLVDDEYCGNCDF